MIPPETSSAAARLCAACGMCCDGAMFHTVEMQPGDSPRELAALGLKLKRKKGVHLILQPCPAFREMRCAIYAARPERCRRYECRQLQGVKAGEITEEAALEKIREARRRIAEVDELLDLAGGTNHRRPLSKRYETAMAEPLDAASDPARLAIRNQLSVALAELNILLEEEFHTGP